MVERTAEKAVPCMCVIILYVAGAFEFVPFMPGQREMCPSVTAFEEWRAQGGHSEFTVPVAVRGKWQ